MFLVIDGHNLIGVMPDIDLAEPDDEWQLVLRLRAYCAGRRRLTVVFDSGTASSANWDLSGGCVITRFAPPGTDADTLILQMVQHSKHPSRVTVITNDQSLAAMVRAAGGQVRSASQFARRLSDPSSHSGIASADRPSHDPHDPAFADLFKGFLEADKDRERLADRIEEDADAWIRRIYGDDPTETALAARWLGRFGGRAALEPLLDALTHSESTVRAAALLALAILDDRRAAEAMASRLKDDSSAMVREAAAQALSRLGGPEAEAALMSALTDSKRKVRKAAQAGLAQVQARKGDRG